MLFSYIKWKFYHNYHMEHMGVSTKMDDDIDDLSSDFLPDLDNEKKCLNNFYLITKNIMQMNNSLELELTSQSGFCHQQKTDLISKMSKTTSVLLDRLYCNIPMIKRGKNYSKNIFVMTRSVSN